MQNTQNTHLEIIVLPDSNKFISESAIDENRVIESITISYLSDYRLKRKLHGLSESTLMKYAKNITKLTIVSLPAESLDLIIKGLSTCESLERFNLVPGRHYHKLDNGENEFDDYYFKEAMAGILSDYDKSVSTLNKFFSKHFSVKYFEYYRFKSMEENYGTRSYGEKSYVYNLALNHYMFKESVVPSRW